MKIEKFEMMRMQCLYEKEVEFDLSETNGDLSLEAMEEDHIRRVLERCNWNRTVAAKELGIGYNTLWRKIKKFGIEPPD